MKKIESKLSISVSTSPKTKDNVLEVKFDNLLEESIIINDAKLFFIKGPEFKEGLLGFNDKIVIRPNAVVNHDLKIKTKKEDREGELIDVKLFKIVFKDTNGNCYYSDELEIKHLMFGSDHLNGK